MLSAHGVKIGHRTYDFRALNAYRRQRSGVNTRKGLWEVHHDPYDVTLSGSVITTTVAGSRPVDAFSDRPSPFGEHVWDHAREAPARLSTRAMIPL